MPQKLSNSVALLLLSSDVNLRSFMYDVLLIKTCQRIASSLILFPFPSHTAFKTYSSSGKSFVFFISDH